MYYSEQIKEGNIDIVIRYTLDNYIAVSGKVGNDYVTRAGYLINLDDLDKYNDDSIDASLNEIEYKDITIKKEETSEYTINKENTEPNNLSAVQYYKDAYNFTYWFLKTIKVGNYKSYLNIGSSNDPEDENSSFVQHKRKIIKEKIEETLNSSITAYANKARNDYKMPKFTEEDWNKVYNNISVISFVQGMNLGFKNYNNYCILNSTNNNEYVNPNLIYFADGDSYHDIRCNDNSIDWSKVVGYKIGSFEKQIYETQKVDESGNHVIDAEGNVVTENKYYYKHNELACYNCINGNNLNSGSVYDYVRNESTDKNIKIAYFSALARERMTTTKLLNSYNAEYIQKYTVKYDSGEINNATNMPGQQSANIGEAIRISENIPQDPTNKKVFSYWTIIGEDNTQFYPSTSEEASSIIKYKNVILTAVWKDNHEVQTSVAKIGSVEYQSLQEAVKAAENNDEIELLKDITLTSDLEIQGYINIKINGGSYTINVQNYSIINDTPNLELNVNVSSNSSSSNNSSVICNNGGLIIKGGTYYSEIPTLIENNSKLRLDGGKFYRKGFSTNPVIWNKGIAIITKNVEDMELYYGNDKYQIMVIVKTGTLQLSTTLKNKCGISYVNYGSVSFIE